MREAGSGAPLQGARGKKVWHSEGAHACVALGYYGAGLRPVCQVVIAELSFGHFTRPRGKVIVSDYRNRKLMVDG
jgi:hypothetical protein